MHLHVYMYLCMCIYMCMIFQANICQEHTISPTQSPQNMTKHETAMAYLWNGAFTRRKPEEKATTNASNTSQMQANNKHKHCTRHEALPARHPRSRTLLLEDERDAACGRNDRETQHGHAGTLGLQTAPAFDSATLH